MADFTEEKASIVRDEEEEDSKQHQGPPDKYNVVYWTILLIGEPSKKIPSNLEEKVFKLFLSRHNLPPPLGHPDHGHRVLEVQAQRRSG